MMLNSVVEYLDQNYKLIFERLWPRRRGAAGDDEAAGETSADKKNKEKTKDKDRKSSTKIKVIQG